jgi:PadR family transcriptional regulator, regulatory protein PadR
VRLGAGTLYGALARLADEGLVAVEREEVVAGRRRRYHRLTEEGRAALANEAQRLHARAEVVHSRLARVGRAMGATS